MPGFDRTGPQGQGPGTGGGFGQCGSAAGGTSGRIGRFFRRGSGGGRGGRGMREGMGQGMGRGRTFTDQPGQAPVNDSYWEQKAASLQDEVEELKARLAELENI